MTAPSAQVCLGASSIPLEDWGPRTGADRGTPITSGHEIYAGESPAVQTGLWECTPGGWAIENRPDTESMHLLSGRIRITDADGTTHDLAAGDTFVLPKGWSGRWDVLETVRKVYVITP